MEKEILIPNKLLDWCLLGSIRGWKLNWPGLCSLIWENGIWISSMVIMLTGWLTVYRILLTLNVEKWWRLYGVGSNIHHEEATICHHGRLFQRCTIHRYFRWCSTSQRRKRSPQQDPYISTGQCFYSQSKDVFRFLNYYLIYFRISINFKIEMLPILFPILEMGLMNFASIVRHKKINRHCSGFIAFKSSLYTQRVGSEERH